MVPGLAGKTYEERAAELGLETPEEGRHQAPWPIGHGAQDHALQGGQLDHSCWFEKAADGQKLGGPSQP
jgi:hypothetical protein